MRKLFLLAMIALPMAVSAHEDENEGHGHHRHHFMIPPILWDGHGPKHGPCADVKLDAGQKTKLKDAYFKFEETQIGLEADAKRAHLQKMKVMMDPKSDLKAAQAASSAVIDAKTKLMVARDTFKNQISFEILKPEQRIPFRMCQMQFRHKFGHEKHGPHGPPPPPGKAD